MAPSATAPLGCRLLALAALTMAMTACGDARHGPLVTLVLPVRAPSGATLDILGERFDGEQRHVSFGGAAAEASYWHPDRVEVTVPELEPGSVLLVVTVDGRPSPPVDFEVTAAPGP